MRRILALALVLLGAGAVALAVGAADEEGAKGKTYRIYFDNAQGLTNGGDFKVAGVRAGTTDEPDVVRRGGRPLGAVDVHVSEPGFADLREDARCKITPQSFVGEYYVDCQPGSSGRRLADGGVVPVERTTSPIALDLLNNIFRLPYRDRLRLIVNELGAGLAGRSQDLGEVLRRAHPGLRETSQTLRILGRQTQSIRRLVADGDTVVGALARRRRDVSRFVREAGRTAGVAASRRAELARAFNRLPAFLGELDPYMVRLGQVATAQQPVLRDLGAASNELDTFLTRLPRFANAGLPALESLGEASLVGRRAVRATDDDIAELRRLASEVPGLAKPLRQFLQTIDDRKRAVKNDPRAAATDPPAPDKTHISGRGGFTGMEAIWNYFFWQATSTNALDDIGHILRLGLTVNDCSEYFVTREGHEETYDKCQQWLGPYQPGINAPDPTRQGQSAAPGATAAAPAMPSAPAAPPDTAPSPDAGGAQGEGGGAVADPADAGLLDFLLRP
jgi:virulence factor Mce-like protein